MLKFTLATQKELRDFEHKCLCCDCRDTDIHHVITRAAYGRCAEGFDQTGNLWPLCHKHHMEFHASGVKTFSIKYGLHDEYLHAINLKNEFTKGRYGNVRKID
jgi:hypothetical protein